jgi:hypothetical protein
MKLPKINEDSNIRLEWTRELEDGTEELYLIDAFVDLGELEYLNSATAADAEIDILEMYQFKDDKWVDFDIDALSREDFDAVEQALLSQSEEKFGRYSSANADWLPEDPEEGFYDPLWDNEDDDY